MNLVYTDSSRSDKNIIDFDLSGIPAPPIDTQAQRCESQSWEDDSNSSCAALINVSHSSTTVRSSTDTGDTNLGRSQLWGGGHRSGEIQIV